ncbi:hypothetical protein TRIUR3_28721 [Triticum urartu]|uniref:Flowering-promoting factor 1-like protein 1 n=1 Tax=Triticum urartu TaxID=4572 RepID=M7ZAH2_TRIUA|nr:hypothetical protein TRIUR3_28721 [Triticum urartu]
MSGVWVFKNGVVRLVENPGSERTSTVVSSYATLEAKLTALGWERYYEDPALYQLTALGWERYYEDPALYQFHKRGCLDLISLPRDFNHFSSVHMYDVVIKNRESFRVVDA